ncbi:MAG: F-type H+-transporting ATPase subunit b [Pseudomonadota bacterium]|nr:F-type H+-transporting ATPase subunit b [Pseudomonadota bacterium]
MTLVVQMLVFAGFVWFTMKFVWPPLTKALDDRQAKIAEGLAAAERGRHELELAQNHIKEELKQAKAQSADLIEKANKQSALLIEEARLEAKESAGRILKQAEEQIALEMQRAQQKLRDELAQLVLAGMEKVIQGTLSEAAKKQAVDQLITEIAEG